MHHRPQLVARLGFAVPPGLPARAIQLLVRAEPVSTDSLS